MYPIVLLSILQLHFIGTMKTETSWRSHKIGIIGLNWIENYLSQSKWNNLLKKLSYYHFYLSLRLVV